MLVSLPFPPHPLFLSLPLSLSVCLSGSIQQEKVPGSTNSCIIMTCHWPITPADTMESPIGGSLSIIELTNVFQTTWNLAPEILSGCTCPAHVQNHVSTTVCMWQLWPTHTALPDSLPGSMNYVLICMYMGFVL